MLLFEGPVSGSGEVADWEQARELATQTRLILAGGLTPDNVGEAIGIVRPYGVDVSSGVEIAPGHKDPERIRRFVAAVRAAERDMDSIGET
jgi:phosphoribosylanthranilate isomerase